MQISGPRGKKSLPTRASSTLDFPLLWLPTTATCGKSSRNSALACEPVVLAKCERSILGIEATGALCRDLPAKRCPVAC